MLLNIERNHFLKIAIEKNENRDQKLKRRKINKIWWIQKRSDDSECDFISFFMSDFKVGNKGFEIKPKTT